MKIRLDYSNLNKIVQQRINKTTKLFDKPSTLLGMINPLKHFVKYCSLN